MYLLENRATPDETYQTSNDTMAKGLKRPCGISRTSRSDGTKLLDLSGTASVWLGIGVSAVNE